MNENREDGPAPEQVMEMVSGLLDAVAIFAISLDPEGMTRASAFAALLMDFRKTIEPGSMKEVVIDQLLHNLAGEEVESLLRRQRFQLLPGRESPETVSTPEKPGSSEPGRNGWHEA